MRARQMNTKERVEIKRKARRYDIIVRWAEGIGIMLLLMLLCGFAEGGLH